MPGRGGHRDRLGRSTARALGHLTRLDAFLLGVCTGLILTLVLIAVLVHA